MSLINVQKKKKKSVNEQKCINSILLKKMAKSLLKTVIDIIFENQKFFKYFRNWRIVSNFKKDGTKS